VPQGEYVVRIIGGTRWDDGLPFGVTAEILEGKFSGRRVSNRFSELAEREVQNMGITSPNDLFGLCCLLGLTVASAPDGSQYNLATRFQPLEYEPQGLSDFLPYEG
jgi:hypothetical protein